MQLATYGQFTPALQRRLNTWYSINDGNWSDPNTWMSNALDKKNHLSPQPGDNVFINHTVKLDTTITVNNVSISGTLKADNSSRTLTLNGNLQATGAMDFTGSNVTVVLNGNVNSFTNLVNAGTSTFIYQSLMYQDVQPVSYFNLNIYIGPKGAVANLTVTGALVVNTGTLDLYGFDLSVTGTSTIRPASPFNNATTILRKTGSGTITMTGNVTFGANSFTQIDFSGNPNIEFKGGIGGFSGTLVGGAGTWKFSTNNQSWATDFCSVVIPGPVVVDNVTLTLTAGSANTFLTLGGTINGTTGISTLKMVSLARMHVTGTGTIMATGVFDTTTFGASTDLGFDMTGSFTLPYSAFSGGISVNATGTKTLLANTTIGGALNVTVGTLECAGFTLSVTGATNIMGSSATFSQNAAGALLFVGKLAIGSAAHFTLGGNPTMELRGGFGGDSATMSVGTSTWNITTNNQTVDFSNKAFTIAGAFNIVGAITVTIAAVSLSSTVTFTGIINGSVSGSILILGINSITNYQNAQEPMQTGVLYGNQAANTMIYGAAGNQNIQTPADPSTPGYKNLTLNGSGAKKLLGNVSVKGVYTLTSPATLNSNGFALTNP